VRVLLRLTMQVALDGKPMYYAAVHPDTMEKSTTRHISPETMVTMLRTGALSAKLPAPGSKFQWVLSRIEHDYKGPCNGVRITRHWRGPYRPEELMATDEALDAWVQWSNMALSKGGP